MNTFGQNFRVEIFGESHGPVIGVTIDGVPAGLPLTEDDFAADIDRRRPGATSPVIDEKTCGQSVATSRRENDIPHILSGVYQGRTTGAPLTIQFTNADVNNADYEAFVNIPRPGHADFSAGQRFGGWNDPRGGGQFSGRLTIALVAAGVVAKKVLRAKPPVDIAAELVEIGGIADRDLWEKVLSDAAQDGDSLGGIVRCKAVVPAGLGEPFWNSVESLLSHAIFAIPGVRGIEFGDGFRAAAMKGSEHNDPFGQDGLPLKNGSGGINGGITNGAPIEFRVAFKPTSSINASQKTLNFETGEMTDLRVCGRHDVCFALRTPVTVEAVTAIVLADLAL